MVVGAPENQSSPPEPPKPRHTPSKTSSYSGNKRRTTEYGIEDLFKLGVLDPVYRGLCIIPVVPGTKRPLVEWKEYQEKPYPGPFPLGCNYAVVCGRVSGNLVVVDFDDPSLLPREWEELSTLMVKTPRGGVHVYFKLAEPVGTYPRVGGKPVDIRGEGGCALIPPSRVRREDGTEVEYTFLKYNTSILELDLNQFERLMQQVVPGFRLRERRTARAEVRLGAAVECRRIGDAAVLRLKELLKPVYVKGQRDLVVLYVTGAMRKASVCYEDARRLVELLVEESGDEERAQRLYVLDRTYGLRANPPRPEEMKGSSGLFEILADAYGPDKARGVLAELMGVLNTGVLGYVHLDRVEVVMAADNVREGIYYVADYAVKQIYRGRRVGDAIERGKVIASVVPTKVVVYEDPLGGVRKFEVTFEGETYRCVGPATIQDIVGRLLAEGLVRAKNLAYDAIAAVLSTMVLDGYAEVRREIDKPGFYVIEGELVKVKWDGSWDAGRLREALELLRELRTVWYTHLGARFTAVVKWALVAPFGYAMKQLRGDGVHVPYLLLYGTTKTGKTTLGEITQRIWGVEPVIKTGASISTVPRLGAVVSTWTLPIVIDEATEPLNTEPVREALKAAVGNRVARGRFELGMYVEIPSLTPLVLTMNAAPPLDDALLRRTLVIGFTYGDRLAGERIAKFDAEVRPRLSALGALGAFAYEYVAKRVELLRDRSRTWWDLAEEVLVNALEAAGLDLSSQEWNWLVERYEGVGPEDVDELILEDVRAKFVAYINDVYAKHFPRAPVTMEQSDDSERLEARLRLVLTAGFSEVMRLRREDDSVVVLASTVGRLGIEDLKSVAQRLAAYGAVYKYVKIGGKSYRAMVIPLRGLVEFLAGRVEDADS